MNAVKEIIDPHFRLNTFEIFGLDFMINDDFEVKLIEINTNPCLEFSSKLLAKIFTTMIDNAFKIALDPLFPPPFTWSQSRQNQL